MHFDCELLEVPPLLLHGEHLARADANSPVHFHDGRVFAFMSHYQPLGHSYLRIGRSIESLDEPFEPVRLIDDPDPTVGKWIESTWRSKDGRLFGWYHAEEIAPCPRQLFLPHIGALVSDNDGHDWHCLGEVLRAPGNLIDCDYQNGFFAGGYGDFSVIADAAEDYFYMHFSSYVSDEAAQGISVARYKIADSEKHAETLEIWRNGAWRSAAEGSASPVHAVVRGWKNRDPDAFWGPAVHYNRSIEAYVMMLNRTRNGKSNMVQEGVYVSFNRTLEDPSGWTSPEQIIKGGVWYPEVIGLEQGDGDTMSGKSARLFMSGFSAWHIRFSPRQGSSPSHLPISLTNQDWIRLFGPAAPARLGIG